MDKIHLCHSCDQRKKLRSPSEDMGRHGIPKKRPGAIGQEEAKQVRNLGSWGKGGKVRKPRGSTTAAEHQRKCS